MARAIAMSLVLMLSWAALLARANPPPPAAYRVIVHPRNPVHGVDRSLLADAFLKKVTRWSHGEAIRPVDLTDSAPRRKFSEEVLGRSVAAVRSYWQQQIFSGRGIPPPELDGDQAVVRFVLQNAGAVGYVSGNADVGAAKVLAVR
jgi:ABC-type phosphate transport system substrate-binding protein